MNTNDEFSPNTNATGKRSITPIAIHHSDTGVIQLEETVVDSGFLLCHKYNDHRGHHDHVDTIRGSENSGLCEPEHMPEL